jgi:hypothetical protein
MMITNLNDVMIIVARRRSKMDRMGKEKEIPPSWPTLQLAEETTQQYNTGYVEETCYGIVT